MNQDIKWIKFQAALSRAVKAAEKEKGRTIQDEIVRMAYDEKEFPIIRLEAFRLIAEVLTGQTISPLFEDSQRGENEIRQ